MDPLLLLNYLPGAQQVKSGPDSMLQVANSIARGSDDMLRMQPTQQKWTRPLDGDPMVETDD